MISGPRPDVIGSREAREQLTTIRTNHLMITVAIHYIFSGMMISSVTAWAGLALVSRAVREENEKYIPPRSSRDNKSIL